MDSGSNPGDPIPNFFYASWFKVSLMNRDFVKFLFGAFLISLSTLCFEVALAFEFAYIFWFYLSFIVIALALFGIGIGSVVGYFLRTKYDKPHDSILFYSSVLAGLGMFLSLAVTFYAGSFLPLPTSLGSTVYKPLLSISAVLGTALIPFIFSGIFLSVALSYPTSKKRYISFIYFADLVGAGLGAFLITFLLPYSSVEKVMVICGFLSIAAGLLFIEPFKRRHVSLIVLSLFAFSIFFINTDKLSPQPMEGKFLATAIENGATLEDSQWTQVSRVDVIEYENSSLKRFVENGEYPITISRGVSQTRKDSDPRWLMFYKKPESMLAIGSGGGVELAMALIEGVEHIQAIEINPFIVDYMRNEAAQYSGRIYFNPRVETQIEDGRTFIHRSPERYDLIENGVLGSAGLVVPSTAMLTTKDMNVYTVEANQEYIRHLTDDGVAVTIIYGLLDDFNVVDRKSGITAMTLKQYSTVREALAREGLDPSTHFVMLGFVQEAGNFQDSLAQAEYTFIFKNPLTPDDESQLLNEAKKFNMQVLYSPYSETGNNLGNLISNLPENKDISPATDDRPFFYFTDRIAGTILAIIIFFILLLTLAFIILPIGIHQKIDFSKADALMIFYFLSIGLGYILVEVTFIHRLVLFLGRPSYAFQVVLFSMLIFSGLGSLASGFFIRDEKSISKNLYAVLILTFILVMAYSAFIYDFVIRFIQMELVPKLLLTIGVLIPPAFIMGMPFPLALRQITKKNPNNVIWMYGINSTGSVMASVVGMYVSLMYGFSSSLLLGGFMYCLAFFAVFFSRAVE